MGTIRKTAREKALAEASEHQATLAKWEAEQAAAEAELASLQSRAGDEVLADETAGSRLSRSMQELRDRAYIASQAAAAVRPRLLAAQRAAVAAEADEVALEVAKARAKLQAHDTRTEQLLAALREHDGVTYVPKPYDDPLAPGEVRVCEIRTRELLAEEVAKVELRELVLREVAAGRDPAPELAKHRSIHNGKIFGLEPREFYPPSVWGPTAVLPAPAYRGEIERVQDSMQRLDDQLAELPQRIAGMEAQQHENRNRVAGLPLARRQQEELPARRDALTEELEALTGGSE